MANEVEVSDYSIPSDKMYAVVELVVDKLNEEGEVEVKTYACPASSNWLKNVKRVEDADGGVIFNCTCMWPKDEKKLSDYLERRSKPGADWKEYKFTRILKFCRSIGHVKEQTNLATEKTNLTDSDVPSTKRMLQKPMRLRCSSQPVRDHAQSSDDSESESPPITALKIIRAGQTTNLQQKSNSNGVLIALSSAATVGGTNTVNMGKESGGHGDANNNSDEDECNISHNQNKDSSGDEHSISVHKPTMISSPSLTSNLASFSSTSTPTNSKPSRKTPPSSTTYVTKQSNFSPRRVMNGGAPVTHLTFMREMTEIQKSITSLKILANKVYNCVCPIVERTEENKDGRGMPALPIQSLESMKKWEEWLRDHDNALYFVRLLTERCSITTLKDSVNGMMRFMISNKVASSFNYKGKNKKGARFSKLSFLGTRSCTAVNAALKAYSEDVKRSGARVHYSTGAEEVGTALGLWLKDAPKRFLLDLRSSQLLPASATKVPDEMFLVPEEGFSLE